MTGARRTAGWWKKIPAGYPVRFVALAMLALVVVAYCRSDDLRDWMVDDTRFAAEIREAALTHGIEPELVRAVVFQESRFDGVDMAVVTVVAVAMVIIVFAVDPRLF